MSLLQRLKKIIATRGNIRQENKNGLPPFYKVYPPALTLGLVDILGIISHRYRFAYFRIFKAANSTIVSSLYHAETGQKLIGLDELQSVKDNYYSRPSSLSIAQVSQLQNSYFKFTFVRNPYTRVLAAYLDKIVSNEARKRDKVAEFLGKPPNSEVTFDHFLDYLERGGIDHNAHWARQTDLLTIPLNELDLIGRTENLVEDLSQVLSSIFEPSQPIISVREHATNATTIAQELDVTRKKRIFQLYEPDFDNFEYKR